MEIELPRIGKGTIVEISSPGGALTIACSCGRIHLFKESGETLSCDNCKKVLKEGIK